MKPNTLYRDGRYVGLLRLEGKMTFSWARLIHKIFEIEPLKCVKCGGEMRFLAFIINTQETKKILEHIGGPTIRPPSLKKPDMVLQVLDEFDYIDLSTS